MTIKRAVALVTFIFLPESQSAVNTSRNILAQIQVQSKCFSVLKFFITKFHLMYFKIHSFPHAAFKGRQHLLCFYADKLHSTKPCQILPPSETYDILKRDTLIFQCHHILKFSFVPSQNSPVCYLSLPNVAEIMVAAVAY